MAWIKTSDTDMYYYKKMPK